MTAAIEQQPQSVTGTACLEWWKSLIGAENPATRNSGHLAELRRADTVLDVVSCPSYPALSRRFPWLDQNDPLGRLRLDRLAVVAHTLPHVRSHDAGLRLGQQMGRNPVGSSLPPVSELRFRRLVQVTRNEDLMAAMRRLVALLDGTVNVIDLSETVVWWGTPSRMKKLAFDYYGATDTKPKKQ